MINLLQSITRKFRQWRASRRPLPPATVYYKVTALDAAGEEVAFAGESPRPAENLTVTFPSVPEAIGYTLHDGRDLPPGARA